MSDKWNTDQIIAFLEEYLKHGLLWDTTDELYSNRDARTSAERQIMKVMKLENMDIKLFRNKMRNIRSTYRQEATRMIKSKKSGAETEDEYTSILVWFKLADKFLRKTLHNRENLLAHSVVNQDGGNDTLSCAEESTPTQQLEPNHSNSLVRGAISQSVSSPTNKKRKIDPLDAVVKALTAVVEVPKEDEIDCFGKYIAAQLKSLPSDAALELQIEIQQLIGKRRLELLRQNNTSPAPSATEPSDPSTLISSPSNLTPQPHQDEEEIQQLIGKRRLELLRQNNTSPAPSATEPSDPSTLISSPSNFTPRPHQDEEEELSQSSLDQPSLVL